jgi:hypothetical protein
MVSTALYLWWGLYPNPKSSVGPRLAVDSIRDWLRGTLYSVRVMTLLRPDDLTPIGYAKIVHTVESVLGPLLLGLFGLAIRQRLKR